MTKEDKHQLCSLVLNMSGKDYAFLCITKDRYKIYIGCQSINDKYNEVLNNNEDYSEEVAFWTEIDNNMYAYLPDEELEQCHTVDDVIEKMKFFGIDIPEELL